MLRLQRFKPSENLVELRPKSPANPMSAPSHRISDSASKRVPAHKSFLPISSQLFVVPAPDSDFLDTWKIYNIDSIHTPLSNLSVDHKNKGEV